MNNNITKDNDEDIDELINLQKEFENGKKKPAASCIKPKLKTDKCNNKEKNVTFLEKLCDEHLCKHNNNKDKVEESTELVMSTEPILVDSIFERFTGPFEIPERCVPFDLTEPCTSNYFFTDDINETGFPNVLDLSKYWLSDNEKETQKDIIYLENDEPIKKSLFAQAFDELNANQTNAANKVSEFKKNRQKNKTEVQIDDSKLIDCKVEQESSVKTKKTKLLEEEAIKKLEVFRDYGDVVDSYSRLAMDPINVNLATKVMKNTVPRQEANIIRLFDILKHEPPKGSEEPKLTVESIEVCNYARSKLEDIKSIYLEQIQVEIDKKVWRFAADVNPIVNGAWTLIPIRRVVDAVQLREDVVTEDDIEICVLAFSWLVLLLIERPTLIQVLSQPNEIFVRLAEVYLLGPELFENDILKKSVKILLNDFIFEKGLKNLLTFRLSACIASLDAFMPFYEELLKCFEECSVGNNNFALVVLTPAYMNSSIGDGLMLAQTIWAPGRNIVRQITIPKQSSTLIIDSIKQWRKTRIAEVEEQQYQAYSQLLSMYAAAIRNEHITRERNPTVYDIAASELGEFVQRHKSKNQQSEYSLLINLLINAVEGRLNL